MAFTLPLRGIRAAIIDLDGTMLDTAQDFVVALNTMLAPLDAPPVTLEEVRRFVGKGTEHLIQTVLARSLPPDAVQIHFAQALQRYQTAYLAINGQHAKLYPGVREGLHALQHLGLTLACVTNKPIAFTLPLLESKGLSTCFACIYGGDSLARKKPDPLPLLQVCQDLALQPHQVVAIGDSENDALAARAAGMPVLTVPYGYNHGQPVQQIDSDGIVSTLLEAATVLVP